MSTQTTTYSTGGTYTYTAPSTLLNGSVQVTVDGSPGKSSNGQKPGPGGQVSGTISTIPSGTLGVYVGDTSGNGYHTGGAGSAGGGSGPGWPGDPGGGSSAVLSGATLLIEAGGGGGTGGDDSADPFTHDGLGGPGGKGGLSATGGAPGIEQGAGSGAYWGGGGGGGGGHQGNGSAGRSTHTNHGGTAPGGGGDSGVNVTLKTCGGAGGAGGSSFAASSVAGVTYTDGGSASTGSVKFVATVADAPLAPTLTSPANGAYLDANAAGVTFDWGYNPGADSGTQQAYALRVLISGSYQYWNATSSAFQSSIVWNSSAASSVTVPAGKLADGVSYNWSVATQESFYALQGPFASDFTFTGSAMPTVTVTSPSGTISSATPTVTWTETLGGGDVQTAFRVVIYTLAVTLQSGFSAGVTTPTVDSGVVSSAALSWAVPGGSALAQAQWVAYVQITETGSITSSWTSTSFTVAYDPPAAPTITASTGTSPAGVPDVTLTVTCHDNLLSADDASFESSLGTWTAGTNTTAAQSTTQAEDGAESMSLTATASGNVSAQTATGTAGYAVQPSVSYSAMASFRAATTGRAMFLSINWYTSTGTLISGASSATINDTTTGWTEASLTAVSPSNAAYAQVQVIGQSLGASEVHYIDECGLYLAAAVPSWTRGGLIGSELVSIQCSDDNGVTWGPVRGATLVSVPLATEQVQVVDYEAKFGVTRLYSATVSAQVTLPTPGIVTSPAAQVSATVTASQWLLTDPLDSTVALSFQRIGTSGSTSNEFDTSAAATNVQVPVSFELDTAEQIGVFYGWGDPDPIIQRGTVLAPTLTVAGYLVGYTAWQTWKNLTGRAKTSAGTIRQAVLLLRSDMGDAWYVVIGPGTPDQVLRAPDRVTNPQVIITLSCTVTAAP